uniref:Uncharacterized protein n=1 Tax=Vitis vinifera TaxID=29760 RepID=F6HJX2_VITVI
MGALGDLWFPSGLSWLVLQQVQGQALGLQVNHQSPKLELPGVSYNVRQPWIPGATSDLLESYNCHHFLLSLID